MALEPRTDGLVGDAQVRNAGERGRDGCTPKSLTHRPNSVYQREGFSLWCPMARVSSWNIRLPSKDCAAMPSARSGARTYSLRRTKGVHAREKSPEQWLDRNCALQAGVQHRRL